MSGEDIQQVFRLAMRRVASTVTIVSAQRDGGERHGTTATSVTSISMEPPSVLVCFNQAAGCMTSCTARTAFALTCCTRRISTLPRSSAATRAAEERFASGDWRAMPTACLILPMPRPICSAGRSRKSITARTRFLSAGCCSALTREDVSPLVYRDGRYGSVTPDDRIGQIKKIRRVSSRWRARGLRGRAAHRGVCRGRGADAPAALLQTFAQGLQHAAGLGGTSGGSNSLISRPAFFALSRVFSAAS